MVLNYQNHHLTRNYGFFWRVMVLFEQTNIIFMFFYLRNISKMKKNDKTLLRLLFFIHVYLVILCSLYLCFLTKETSLKWRRRRMTRPSLDYYFAFTFPLRYCVHFHLIFLMFCCMFNSVFSISFSFET